MYNCRIVSKYSVTIFCKKKNDFYCLKKILFGFYCYRNKKRAIDTQYFDKDL